ncbi:MAPEG family protein [Sphingorhabdus soli]|uniref:MAPEG family protein n=1 Tax=Flavisphingopyxis soli TaxID=2601267 RepID=A0A5C6UBF5_9SPHN|nr:MAPEG family protein [Sphingorhabdus soli]TXC69118.1 MAPEG family protein [Sphingorhabdus soli]
MVMQAMLGPVVALVMWSMIIWLWMYVTRIPAMQRAKIDVKNLVGGKGSDLDQVLPPQIQWKAHNYNHLMEQPTLFYAIAITLALVGAASPLAVALAWSYVALRVVHSLVQVTVNRIAIRFAIFALSSLVLIALTIAAALAVF